MGSHALGYFCAGPYWAFHLEQDKQRNHASRYEDGKIPDPLPAPKPRPKRIK